jgi:hypothetical protein
VATDADLRTRAPDESTIKGSGKTKTVPVVIDHDSPASHARSHHHPRIQRGNHSGDGFAVRAMTYSSKPGENSLDLFGGSGSTLIGAEQTGRKAFLMGLDQAYCDVIVKRFEEFTGKKVERVPAEVNA